MCIRDRYVSDISNVNKTKYMLLVISSSKYIYMKIKKCVKVQFAPGTVTIYVNVQP